MSVETEVAALKEEVKALTGDVHTLQRQASSRRGPEGGRGPQGIPGIQGPKGDAGTVSREQATAMFQEVVNDVFKDEISKNLFKDVIKGVVSEISFRLVKKANKH
jgi:hypothetical protein